MTIGNEGPLGAGILARNLKVKSFEAVDEPTLETNINDWLKAGGEKVVHSIMWSTNNQHNALVVYSE